MPPTSSSRIEHNPLRPSAIPSSEYEASVLGWLTELIDEGRSYLAAQPGYDKIGPTMERIMGLDEPVRPSGMSVVCSNEIAKTATLIAAALTDIKPFWDFRTQNQLYEESIRILKGLSKHWYLSTSVDQKLFAVVKYALAAGTGYSHMVWNPDLQDIDVLPEDPRDVYPIRPAASPSSVQDAMAVIIERERPLAYLESRFPYAKGRMQPTRDGNSANSVNERTRLGKFLSKLSLSPMEIYRQMLGGPSRRIGGPIPVTDFYTAYIRDNTIAEHDTEVGQFFTDPSDGKRKPVNNWSYVALAGQPLYPRRRLILATPDCVLYDGPNIYWHGMAAITSLTLDPWPWSALGKSPLWDLLPLQDSLDKMLRYVEDRIALIMRPPVIADRRSVSESELRKFDPARPGQKVRHTTIGQGIQVVPVPGIDPAVPAHIDFLIRRMQYLAGVNDLSAAAQLNQIPAQATLEKLIEAMTPDLRARSRAMETYMREFATMLTYNFAQFYTVNRRITILGPSGQTIDDWDFDPDTWLPSFLPSDYQNGNLAPDRMLSPRPRYDRIREFMRHMTFHVEPGTLLNDAESQDRMMYLQLARMGYLDLWTLLEKLGIPNVGKVPEGSIPERIAAQAQLGAEPTVSPAGRKASGQEPPRMRPDGKISESG
jgi:hypothetical protein